MSIANDITLNSHTAPHVVYPTTASKNMASKLSQVFPEMVAKFHNDEISLKNWAKQIHDLPDNNPNKTRLLTKYKERLLQFIKNRASYKRHARFMN